MRSDIEFKAEDGTMLRGWHYRPERGGPRHPTVVMAHGFSAVKEMYLDRYAERFAAQGIASLVYDNRNFGASDGQPRQEIDPQQQIRDYRDAITFAETLPQTDAARIGVFGSSYSGAHVLVVAATDRRVKCVVSQVPLVSGWRNARRLIRADQFAGLQAMFDQDRRGRYRGEAPLMIPVTTNEVGGAAALPTADSWTFMNGTRDLRAPAWKNEVTLRSVEMFTEYEPGAWIGYISPTPLLMLVALQDHLTVADEALAAYERALQPKKLVTLKGGHFEAYVEDFETAGGAACDWFREHLAG
jgi:fermentation-respiration switch protein FrsA (DUF1100 family)